MTCQTFDNLFLIQLKRLLLISVTLLLGVMSAGVVEAQTTTYTFSESFGAGSSIEGQVLFNNDGSLNSYSGVTFNNAGVTGISDIDTSYMNHVSAPGGVYPAGDYFIAFQFTQASQPYSVEVSSAGSYNHPGFIWYGADMAGIVVEGLTSSVLNSAPEIDGSLAPKVGFLLGCLFLMFGRKKQNTEPMTTT